MAREHFPAETVGEIAFRVGVSEALVTDILTRDAIEADPDELFADTHARMDILRQIYKVEPGQHRERTAER